MTIVLPALPFTYRSNTKEVSDKPGGKTVDEHVTDWEGKLSTADQRTLDTVALLYQMANARIGVLETKAIGLLGVVSVVAAGGFVACTGPRWAAVLGVVGLGYVLFAAVACCMVIIPKARITLLLEDSTSPTGGYAEMAATTRALEPVNVWVANLVTSAVYDLIRSGTVTFAALLVLVIGWGR